MWSKPTFLKYKNQLVCDNSHYNIHKKMHFMCTVLQKKSLNRYY